jgi:SAM-dependent methyltransferase
MRTPHQEAGVASSSARDWEEAYLRFETPEEEIRKFMRRLRAMGVADWPRDWVILDLFCGRGGGSEALRRLGFSNVHGIDLSERLLQASSGSRVVGDCMQLPVGNAVADVAIVQGGLHHLPNLPEDLAMVLRNVKSALRPGGLFVMVEPWRTPFLDAVHMIAQLKFVRRLSRKIDALSTMIEHEQRTYEAWLAAPAEILATIRAVLAEVQYRRRWGKIHLSARTRPA